MAAGVLSIILPVRDGAGTLDEALGSARGQRDSAGVELRLRILVIDDGSQDRSRAIAQRHADADPRVRVLSTAPQGQAAALNLALQQPEAQASFISFLDADDRLLSERSARAIRALQDTPDADLLVHPMRAMDAHGQETGAHLGPPPNLFPGGGGARLYERSYLSRIQGVFRRRCLEDFRFDVSLPQGQDYQLYLELVRRNCLFLYSPDDLYCYRLHDGNISRREARARAAEQQVLRGVRLEDVERAYGRIGADAGATAFAMAMVCLRRGQRDTAESLFWRALGLRRSNCGDSLFYLARIAWQRGDHSSAGELLSRCRGLDHREPTAANNLGVVLASAGAWREAAGYFREALRAQPGYRDAAANLTEAGGSRRVSELRFTPARLKRSFLIRYPALRAPRAARRSARRARLPHAPLLRRA